VNGELAVQDHTGRITAHTVNGDITAAGEISRFSADGVNCEIFLDIDGAPDEIRVNTVNGGITARLEEGNPAEYRINSVGGRIQLDDTTITGVRGGYNAKYGTLDRRYLEFRANTVSGNIAVIHAVKPEAPSEGEHAPSGTAPGPKSSRRKAAKS